MTAFSLTVAASIALAGPQLFPVLALLGDVTRAAAETGYEFAASWALPPQELTALFLPDLISSLPATYWGENPIKLHTEYLGAVPIALAILGVAAAWGGGLSGEQRRTVAFLAVASLLGILFALGAATPIHRIAYALLPLIGSLRAPAMMLGPVAVFVALLAAYGWEAVLEGRQANLRVSRLALGLLGGPIALLGAWAVLDPAGLANFALLSWYPAGWPRRPDPGLAPILRTNGLLLLAGFGLAWGGGWAVSGRRVAPWVLVPILVFGILDLWRVDARYLEVRDADAALATDPVIAALQEDADPGDRVWAPNLAGSVRNYRPNELAYHGISSATGLQKFLLQPYATLVGGIIPDQGLGRDPVRRLLNVRYLIIPGAQEDVASLAEASGRHLYSIPSPAGYAFFPAEIELVSDPREAATRTWDNPDPASLSVVESRIGLDPPEAGQGTAAIIRYEPDVIELDVQAERAGLLAVSEIHNAGWRAFVDGEEATIWRVNTAFRGVEIPTGPHRLTFAYRSSSFRIGVWTSLVAVLLIGAVLLRFRFPARTRQEDA
ncbi:YfhO family protein [Candidatus Palauibacter sp.]|uniref:YfhO family protein n=1 Tax=Candidatus Palauibacter sp. TaxID=3101350 RepID=UPI003CC6BF35